MDLTKTYPRSVREKFAGVVQLGRTADKGRAYLAGTVGEYHYNCPMDQAVFEFLGISDHEAFARKAAQLSDSELEKWVRDQYVSKKTHAEIEKWNAEWLGHGPAPGSDGEAYFIDLRNQVAPHRIDVTSWPDLLDLDEKRDVPQRVAA
jgi:uncharacterized protein DUF5069